MQLVKRRAYERNKPTRHHPSVLCSSQYVGYRKPCYLAPKPSNNLFLNVFSIPKPYFLMVLGVPRHPITGCLPPGVLPLVEAFCLPTIAIPRGDQAMERPPRQKNRKAERFFLGRKKKTTRNGLKTNQTETFLGIVNVLKVVFLNNFPAWEKPKPTSPCSFERPGEAGLPCDMA